MKIRSKWLWLLLLAGVTVSVLVSLDMIRSDFEAFLEFKGVIFLINFLIQLTITIAPLVFAVRFRYEAFGETEIDDGGVRQRLLMFRRSELLWSEIKEVGVKKINCGSLDLHCIYFSDRHSETGQRSRIVLKRSTSGLMKFYVASLNKRDSVLDYICKHYSGEVVMRDGVSLI